MKKQFISAALALLAAHQVHAAWVPNVVQGDYLVTLSHGGGSHTYSESQLSYGPLARMVGGLGALPRQMEEGLNHFMRSYAGSNGVNFQSGKLTGDLRLQISPEGGGLMRTRLSDLRYDAWLQFSGRKWGIIKFNCTSHLSLADIAVSASYNALTGQVPTASISLDSQPGSSTDCDSNLSWLLPVVGNLIIRKLEGKIDQGVLQGLHGSLSQGNQLLFYDRDSYQLTGLTRLVPADREITLPNGQHFAIGQYVRNNLAYLLANASMDLKLGKGAALPSSTMAEPNTHEAVGDHMNLHISVPGLSFGVRLHERLSLQWHWDGKCGGRENTECHIP